MPSRDLVMKVLLVLTFVFVFGSASEAEAKSIKSWPGYVPGWGNTCASQFKGCTGQASDVYDACVKEHGRGCSRDYDLDYAGCRTITPLAGIGGSAEGPFGVRCWH